MKKLIIDVDTGVDDAHALLLALAEPNVRVLAITCVSGNTTLDNVITNTLRVLHVCKRTDVPVYRGSSRTLMGQPSPETGFHGNDGLGDTESNDVDLRLVKREAASVAMVRLVDEHGPGEVTLLACGPLTNVALALRLDNNFGRNLKECYIMGGNTTARGNFKICGEFNFACDPEAAKTVLEDLKCQITLVAMETCREHGFPIEWYNNWSNIATDIGRFNKRILDKVIKNMQARGRTKMAMYDAVAMALLLRPVCLLDSDYYYCSVETGGEFSRGMMVVDWSGHLSRAPNVRLVDKFDVKIFADMMIRAVNRIV